MEKPVLSVIIPILNEEDVLPLLFKELDSALSSIDVSHEIIFVNDGSTDGSWRVLESHASSRPGVKAIDLSRNFGHQAAISAGIDCCQGDAAIAMDADLQDPPSLIPDLLARWREGYDVVSAVRVRREGETVLKRFLSHVFYRLLKAMSGVDMALDVGDFRLISRPVIDQVKACREQNRFVRGIIAWVGFRQCNLEYVRPARQAGTTKYSFRKLVRLAFDGLASFSYLPLQLASLLGFFFAGLAFSYVIYVVTVMTLGHRPPPGWTSQVFVALFLGGVQLICLGTIGEYLGRVYDEVRARPLYIVRRVIECDGPRV